MMRPNDVTLELMVKDVDKTLEFYLHTLSFELLAKEGDNVGLYWAKVSYNGFAISFKAARKLQAEVPFFADISVGGSLSLCFGVDDLEGTHAGLEKKFELINHPHITPCGSTQFSIKDINGYVITFERFI